MSERTHNDIILRAEQVTKIFPGTVALNKVDFNVFRGKVNALVGENGAGKSTLTKILAGVETPTKGALFLEGSKVRIRSFHDAVTHGIGMIHQELNLCPNLNVAENIFVAHESINPEDLTLVQLEGKMIQGKAAADTRQTQIFHPEHLLVRGLAGVSRFTVGGFSYHIGDDPGNIDVFYACCLHEVAVAQHGDVVAYF